ncbi:MAG: carboxypeptidase-like regulatory domain-containing protein [Planctomycetota bacterium]
MQRGPVVVAVTVVLAVVWWLQQAPAVDVPGPARAAQQAPERRSEPASAAPPGPLTDDARRLAPVAAASQRAERYFVEGAVLAPSGAPLPRAWIVSDDGARTRSDADGRFRLSRLAEAAGPTRLLVTARGHAPGTVQTYWGSGGHRVTLDVAGVCAVQVVDAATGRPVEQFEAQLVSLDDAAPRAGPVVCEGPHAGGRLETRVELPSPALLRVVAGDARFAPSSLYEVELGLERPRTVRVALPRWREQTMAVVDPGGHPVAGAQVELLQAPPGRIVERQTEAASAWSEHAGSRASLLATARTDPRGRATLRAPSRGAFWLRAWRADLGVALLRVDAATDEGAPPLALQLRR